MVTPPCRTVRSRARRIGAPPHSEHSSVPGGVGRGGGGRSAPAGPGGRVARPAPAIEDTGRSASTDQLSCSVCQAAAELSGGPLSFELQLRVVRPVQVRMQQAQPAPVDDPRLVRGRRLVDPERDVGGRLIHPRPPASCPLVPAHRIGTGTSGSDVARLRHCAAKRSQSAASRGVPAEARSGRAPPDGRRCREERRLALWTTHELAGRPHGVGGAFDVGYADHHTGNDAR